ncbi:hypothetical protein [Endozoicomonas arenosclerae]|uniref:hypothetical protein n=1 Tax=Endozoicomonas arenosclerae TaxID=1633495 RepID=UPI000785E18D|nr:hypothetical protein [Endozoicomonas arenosclerae]
MTRRLLPTVILASSLLLCQTSTAAVPGWSSGSITSGSVSNASSAAEEFNFKTLKERPVKSVFTYAVGGGNDSYNIKKISDPFKTINLIKQARSLEVSYGSGSKVMPVVVVYTAGGSSSDDAILIDLDQNPDYPDNLWTRFYNISRIAQVSEQNKDDDHPVPATFILNPDLLGEVHKSCQPQYCPIPYKSLKIPLVNALNKAFMELQNDGFMATPPVIPDVFNTNEASFGTYINAINWLLKTLSPSTPLGWQDNIWAGDAIGHRWIHRAATEMPAETILKQHIRDEVTYLSSLNVFQTGNPYRPDFIAFDKWERDCWDAGLEGAGINNGYLYNAPAWEIYFDFVRGVSEAFSPLPVMLFQIPGGHMQVTGDLDQRQNHGSTAPDYILGDTAIEPELSNVQPYIMNTQFKNPQLDYNIANPSVPQYLMTCPAKGDTESCNNSVYTWHKSHWDKLVQSHVFAVMWGGGSTTSMVGLSPDLDDSGWLYQKLKAQGHD